MFLYYSKQFSYRYLPNASQKAIDYFEQYLKTLNRLEFGSFDEFVGIENWDISELEHINLRELYETV